MFHHALEPFSLGHTVQKFLRNKQVEVDTSNMRSLTDRSVSQSVPSLNRTYTEYFYEITVETGG
ncbi:hypothetical protein SAMN06264855_1092 [Halorubrum vacuolatum]|uniref:Uncharacterized protein n=1 Tax=Halorubrum vacuolatum TaxID=63740 RepID=A0A238WNC0_HALVU|nr:hypothetical protein SAMN06264855_1092 [Halorubrum vacuolatum]